MRIRTWNTWQLVMQMGRGLPVTRGYPSRTGRGFPALAGDGSGMGIRYRTRSGYGAGTVFIVRLLGLRFNKAGHRCIYNAFFLDNRHLLLQSPSRQSTIGNSAYPFPNRSSFKQQICRLQATSPLPWMKLLFHRKTPTPSKLMIKFHNNMLGKFDQYWSLIHGVLAIATILDPRFKMKLIEYYFPQIYGDESPREVERIRKLTYDLVKEYHPHAAKQTHSSFGTDFGIDVDDFGDSLAGYDLFVSSTSNVDTYKSELDYYLEENVLPRTGDFDILAWWKTNGLKYPTLQQVVKDVLAIPVSSVASESAFSTAGRHITPHRNRLHPDLVEILICTQDWLWDDNLVPHSNKQNYLGKSEVVKDDDSEMGTRRVPHTRWGLLHLNPSGIWRGGGGDGSGIGGPGWGWVLQSPSPPVPICITNGNTEYVRQSLVSYEHLDINTI
ncbi:hypothetical protein LXL04_031659 [Taraxacum kok-saghyz]